jgi:RHS repeat-associated protein
VRRTTRPENFIVENSYNAQGYLNAVYSPTAQIGDYDASHLRFLLDTAINDAETALNKAQEVSDAALYYQQKAEEYLQLSGTPELDSDLEAQLQSIAAELDAASDILNTQAGSYLDLAEQLTEVAEQLYPREQILMQRYASSGENDNISHYQAMVNDSANIYFWRAKSRDAAGRLTSSLVGNGLETKDIYDQATGQLTDIISSFGYATPTRHLNYEYNSLNNVTRRIDQVQGLNETFEYDGLNRLTRSYVNGQIEGVNYDYNITYSYDALGNITNKSDVGDYVYGNQQRNTGNAGPHALLSAGPDHTGYQYDLNGNMVQGGGRSITWSSFDKPIEFRKDGSVKASFKYGPERFRYLKVTPESNTYYLGKAYERIESSNKLEHKYFIYADGQLVAIHIKATDDGEVQPDKTRYLHKDPLGSIDTITDGQGRIISRMSYEPFGARRGSTVPEIINRGFTGHEHVDEMGLIHMNGRVYDPVTARFISADPLIQFPYDQQSYNRHSYVLNNPLNYTDPTGYSPTVEEMEKEQEIMEGGYLVISPESGDSQDFDPGHGAGTGEVGGYLGGGITYDSSTGEYTIHVNWSNNPPDSVPESNEHTESTQYAAISNYGFSGIAGEPGGWSSMAHTALDVVSWVPVVGSFASAVDSAIYAYEGDLVTAGFVFAGVLGPAGKALGKFGKVANKIPWTSGSVRSAAKSLSKGAKSVTVKSRSQAEELFLGIYQGIGFMYSSGFDGG